MLQVVKCKNIMHRVPKIKNPSKPRIVPCAVQVDDKNVILFTMFYFSMNWAIYHAINKRSQKKDKK